MRCVPMQISTSPEARPATTAFWSEGLRKRDSISTLTGYGASRSANVEKCCWARTVVGTRMATWRPDWTTLKAALKATSVLP